MGALHEQPHRGVALQAGEPRPASGTGQRRRQRRNGELVLPAQPQHGPAGHQHHQPGGRGQELGHQRRRLGHLLEVVQQQHQPPGTQVRLDVGDQRTARGPQPQPGGDRRRHQVGPPHRGEVDEPHPIGEARAEPPGDLQRQPALAHSTRPGEGDQAHAFPEHQVTSGLGLPLPSHQRRHRRRQYRRRRLLRRAGAGLCHLEALAQQHGQVVLDQALQLLRIREVLVGDVTVVFDPVEHLCQPRLPVRRRGLDIDQPRQSR